MSHEDIEQALGQGVAGEHDVVHKDVIESRRAQGECFGFIDDRLEDLNG